MANIEYSCSQFRVRARNDHVEVIGLDHAGTEIVMWGAHSTEELVVRIRNEDGRLIVSAEREEIKR